jgi:hypothetical protein
VGRCAVWVDHPVLGLFKSVQGDIAGVSCGCAGHPGFAQLGAIGGRRLYCLHLLAVLHRAPARQCRWFGGGRIRGWRSGRRGSGLWAFADIQVDPPIGRFFAGVVGFVIAVQKCPNLEKANGIKGLQEIGLRSIH